MRRAAVRAAVAGALVVAAGAGAVMATTIGGGEQAATGAWKPLRSATLERTEVAAARIGRFIYVVGGFERRSGATTAAVERYDIGQDRWRAGALDAARGEPCRGGGLPGSPLRRRRRECLRLVALARGL